MAGPGGLAQVLAQLGLTGGLGQLIMPPANTPGINPAAPAPAAPAAPQGFMDRLAGTLFPSSIAGQQADPAAQKAALLQLGLGMMAAGSRGAGLGEGLFGAYTGAANTFQGAMQKAYENSERKRLEEKDDKRRAEDLDWKKAVYTTEQAGRQLDRNLEAQLTREQIKSAEKRSTIGTEDDRVRADVSRLRLEQEQQDRELLAPIEAKLRAGQPLTQAEKDLYQLIRTGRQPSMNPLAMLMGGMTGGLGDGMLPGYLGNNGNPLLADPRL